MVGKLQLKGRELGQGYKSAMDYSFLSKTANISCCPENIVLSFVEFSDAVIHKADLFKRLPGVGF